MESSPPSEPKLIHDEPIQSSACYIDTNNDDLFSQNPLPEQLLQCEEKDDDGDSNNMDTVQKSQDDLLKAAIGECSYKREKVIKKFTKCEKCHHLLIFDVFFFLLKFFVFVGKHRN